VAPKVFPTAISLINDEYEINRVYTTALNLPHACKQLDQTTVCEGRGNDDVWLSNTTGVQIDQREDECSQGESRQAERCWIGDSFLWSSVETGLESTTESRHSQCGVIGCDVGKRVSAIVVWCATLCSGVISRAYSSPVSSIDTRAIAIEILLCLSLTLVGFSFTMSNELTLLTVSGCGCVAAIVSSYELTFSRSW
jgi:hypothetical protein